MTRSSLSFSARALGAVALSLVAACSSASTDEDVATSEHADTADAISMVACPSDGHDAACPPGSFRVDCKDGREEIDTVAQVSHGQVCAAITTPPVRAGVYQSLNIYGEPDGFGPYMIDVQPPQAGSSKWTVRVYMNQGGCWTWSARSTKDGLAEIACNAKHQCSFNMDGKDYSGLNQDQTLGRKLAIWSPRSPDEVDILHSPVKGSAFQSYEEDRLRWSRPLNDSDRLCDCPRQPYVAPTPVPYYGHPICDATCRGEPAPFGFESPLVFAFDDAPVQFTGAPVGFDFYADGSAPLLDWLKPPSGLLALDLDGNGKIDTGRELFGTSTLLAGTTESAANGFAALAQYDANHDGKIDASDPIFAKLSVWTDTNVDGVSQASELRPLASAGVAAISLDKTQVAHDPNTKASYVDSRATFDYQPHLCSSVKRQIVDVWFAMKPQVHH